MDDDPAGSSHCVMTRWATHLAFAHRHGAGRPAALDALSAPVFRFGACGVLHRPPLQTGDDAVVLYVRLLE